MSRLTQQQEEWIESLSCFRLKTSEEARNSICDFECPFDKKDLNQYIWEHAEQEDKKNSTAVYVVSNPKQEIIFLFALKCGLLHEGQHDDKITYLSRVWAGEIAETEATKREMIALQLKGSLSDKDFHSLLVTRYHQFKNQNKPNSDKADNIHPVYHTIPAIEISHFCRNETACLSMPKDLFPSQKLGKIIFWFKLYPILCKALEYIGAEYAYLFAADATERLDLVNYYSTHMYLKPNILIGASRPTYDDNCTFLCQKLSAMADYRERYILSFNPDKNAV